MLDTQGNIREIAVVVVMNDGFASHTLEIDRITKVCDEKLLWVRYLLHGRRGTMPKPLYVGCFVLSVNMNDLSKPEMRLDCSGRQDFVRFWEWWRFLVSILSHRYYDSVTNLVDNEKTKGGWEFNTDVVQFPINRDRPKPSGSVLQPLIVFVCDYLALIVRILYENVQPLRCLLFLLPHCIFVETAWTGSDDRHTILEQSRC
jgi:hypothetical protein